MENLIHEVYDNTGVTNDYLVITGDGVNSAVFLWEDTDHDTSFYSDDSELTLMTKMLDFNNDNLNHFLFICYDIWL